MRLISTAATLLACASMCLAQTPARHAAEQDPNTFKVDVNLVNVFVSVVDQNGAPVAALGKEHFQLFEDGVKQNIAVFDRHSELPLSIVLAIDASLSARKELKFELQSARAFVHTILRPVDALALYQFSEHVQELVTFTSDLKRIDRGIEQVRVGAATALYDAIYLGSRALQDREGRKVIVLITDGGDTLSSVTYPEAVRAAQQSEAILYSIVIVPIAASAGRNTGGEHALIQLSADTGGKHYYAESIAHLDQAFRRISDELRTQYLLAYYPSRRVAASDFRRIKIELTAPPDAAGPLHARHRTGYYTSKPE
jgi:Ca-activated chloride channel family protein